ncbi:MAG: sensor histidine kinase [Sphingomicrobium sp.]
MVQQGDDKLATLGRGPLHAGLQSVLQTALDAVVVMDRQGHVIGWNGRAEQCFGWTPDEAIGSRLSELVIPERHRAAHEAGLTRFLKTGQGPVIDQHIEIEGLHKDGREVPVELSITASEQFGGQLFIGFIRNISERREQAERQQRLLQESDHRVKNMLTVVSAIAQQTARSSGDLETFEKSFLARLESFARAHRLLAGRAGSDLSMTDLAEQVLGVDVARGRARFDGPELRLAPRQVLGLSMILHELYTNSVKYGALCRDSGDIALTWSERDNIVELIWAEAGEKCEREGHSSGFGEQMIAMSVRADLQGTVERDWRPQGLRATVRFPLETEPS